MVFQDFESSHFIFIGDTLEICYLIAFKLAISVLCFHLLYWRSNYSFFSSRIHISNGFSCLSWILYTHCSLKIYSSAPYTDLLPQTLGNYLLSCLSHKSPLANNPLRLVAVMCVYFSLRISNAYINSIHLDYHLWEQLTW